MAFLCWRLSTYRVLLPFPEHGVCIPKVFCNVNTRLAKMSADSHITQPDDLGQVDQASQSTELDQPLQALNLTKDNPLLIPEIMAEIFSNIPSSDSGTAARMTEVSREWWHVGHRDVWREGSNQLSGLIHDVDDPDRRKYFASLIKTIHFQPGDTILSTEDTTLETLEFP